jgi:hypothetical protein
MQDRKKNGHQKVTVFLRDASKTRLAPSFHCH